MTQANLELANQIYGTQKRSSGQLYTEHVLGVSELMKSIGVKDQALIDSALLHHYFDVKDKSQSQKQLYESYNVTVLQTIQDLIELKQKEVTHIDLENTSSNVIVQTYLSNVKHYRLLLLRLCDKADDITTAHLLDQSQRDISAKKALFLYSPVSRLVGLMKLTRIFEEHAFKVLYPSEHFFINKTLKEKEVDIHAELSEMRTLIHEILCEYGVCDFTIKHRVKSPFSIYKKVKTYTSKGISVDSTLKEIHDVAAMSVLLKTIEDCYKVESVLKEFWEEVNGTRDDYIANPRPSGYQAIHIVLKVGKGLTIEVQLKTYDMHDRNEFGPASHIFYKSGDHFRKYLDENPNWLRDIQNMALNISESPINVARCIHVITPKGHVHQLPEDATVLDFAFHVHEDLGCKCCGAKVNGKIRKISDGLSNGDKIEILIDKRGVPKNDWLEIVRTPKARRYLRKHLLQTR